MYIPLVIFIIFQLVLCKKKIEIADAIKMSEANFNWKKVYC